MKTFWHVNRQFFSGLFVLVTLLFRVFLSCICISNLSMCFFIHSLILLLFMYLLLSIVVYVVDIFRFVFISCLLYVLLYKCFFGANLFLYIFVRPSNYFFNV